MVSRPALAVFPSIILLKGMIVSQLLLLYYRPNSSLLTQTKVKANRDKLPLTMADLAISLSPVIKPLLY
jgi:hypothetical protein